MQFVSITDGENGAWACHVFLSADPGKAESATANVTTLGNQFHHFLSFYHSESFT